MQTTRHARCIDPRLRIVAVEHRADDDRRSLALATPEVLDLGEDERAIQRHGAFQHFHIEVLERTQELDFQLRLVLDGEAVELDLKTNEFSDRQKAQDAVTKWLKAKGYKVESVGILRR